MEEAKSVIAEFLKDRGLTLSAEKTRITHIESGFDFLGWNFRKYDRKLLIKPSEKNVDNHVRKIREIIKAEKDNPQRELIRRLNPIIVGWVNYHAGQVSADTFHKVDFKVWQCLWKWAKRRHPSRSRQWIKDRYFHRVIRKGGTRDWMFGMIDGEKEYRLLQLHSDKPIRRHIKVRADANPFDPEWEEYFEKRNIQLMNRFWSNKLKALWKRQEGICPTCQQVIHVGDEWAVHHIEPRSLGGNDTLDNLQMLHGNCHRQVHANTSVHHSRFHPVRMRLIEARAVCEETRTHGSPGGKAQ